MNGQLKGAMVFLILVVFVMIAVMVIAYVATVSQDTNVLKYGGYYRGLAQECIKKENPSCCFSSLDTMVAGNYTAVPPEGCQRLVVHRLNCPDSLVWCQ